MTKKLLLPALLFAFAALCTTNGTAATGDCSGFTGNNVQYIAVGSSAQFNSFAFAAANLIGTANLNFWASSSIHLKDFNANVSDTAKLWLAWDNNADCHLYAYFSVDSTVGVKDFFSYRKLTLPVANAIGGAVYVDSTAGDSFAACTGVVNAGQPACTGYPTTNPVPSQIVTFIETQPGPSCKYTGTTCTKTTQGALPLAYCGQNSTVQTTAKYCFFNAGHADIRPEDTLYANGRALSSYVSSGGLAGFGYNNTTCGGQAGTTATIGCPFISSFASKGVFNVVKFALTGTDPIGGASLPTYTTLDVGAAPVLVIVSDHDSSGLGAGAPNYAITNVNRALLSGIENGTFGCTGDLLDDGSGPGQPLQVIHREALSGTYNTFEFTGVRTMYDSASAPISNHKQTTVSWFTANDSGQEEVASSQGGPAFNWHALGSGNTACEAGNTAIGDTAPSAGCGDPLYATGVACGSNGNAVHLRAIGTGEMVKAVSQQASSTQPVPDAFGYAFWGYGNIAPMGSGCTGTNTGNVTCSSWLAHYLTVDGIDPLFETPGGANDPTPNPNGAYRPPQCALKTGNPNCFDIPFTHIKDGSYPLWTILRLVTFNNVTTGTALQTTPTGVLAMLAEAEAYAANEATVNDLDDFIPYFHHICPPGETWTQPNGPCASSSSTAYTGDLNLFVLRSHYKQTGSAINPSNGIAACSGTYTDIELSGKAATCTVDTGNDVGGAVITVNADADFHTDYNGGTNPSEYYGLHN
jgi:hypothetical protein